MDGRLACRQNKTIKMTALLKYQRYKVVSLFFLLVYKQKRGPGFKYASNLPGSLLKEQRPNKEHKDNMETVKKKGDREENSKRKSEEHSKKRCDDSFPKRKSEDGLIMRKRRIVDKTSDPVIRKKVEHKNLAIVMEQFCDEFLINVPYI